jgi:valyl-tRNA synthetase
LPQPMTLPASEDLTLADRWILTRLRETVDQMSDLLARYDFGNASETIWRFLWYEFCDWYLEATKAEANRSSRAAVLSYVWNAGMRLLHPIAPFISEEIWLALPHDGETILTATWPDPLEIPAFLTEARRFVLLQHAVERVRNVRAGMGLHPRDRVVLDVPANVPEEMVAVLALMATATVERCTSAGEGVEEGLAAIAVRAPRDLLAERYRKELAHLRSEIDRGERKLGNESFVTKAAPNVVAKEREKLEGYRDELVRVEAALAELKETA